MWQTLGLDNWNSWMIRLRFHAIGAFCVRECGKCSIDLVLKVTERIAFFCGRTCGDEIADGYFDDQFQRWSSRNRHTCVRSHSIYGDYPLSLVNKFALFIKWGNFAIIHTHAWKSAWPWQRGIFDRAPVCDWNSSVSILKAKLLIYRQKQSKFWFQPIADHFFRFGFEIQVNLTSRSKSCYLILLLPSSHRISISSIVRDNDPRIYRRTVKCSWKHCWNTRLW